MWFLIFLKIVSSHIFPFTVLLTLRDLFVIVGFSILTRKEEKAQFEKWEEEFERYVNEVPGFSFVLGLWNLRNRNPLGFKNIL